MPSRKVLFVNSKGFATELCALLPAAEWEVHVALSSERCQPPYRRAALLVGFMLVVQARRPFCAEIDDFLRSHPDIEWVGGFEPRGTGVAGMPRLWSSSACSIT